ncbi:hypothetical protein KEM48_009501 [Puccinia striiformis f. sp. tritici PST-130]|nr:hypothetical protein KEM48_009501 [Puccinia striiformis f. sp. tritici PST-130]
MSLQILVTLAALATLAVAQAPLTVNTPSKLLASSSVYRRLPSLTFASFQSGSAQACLPVALAVSSDCSRTVIATADSLLTNNQRIAVVRRNPPVFVSLIPGGQSGGAILNDFGAQTDSSLTWDVDQPAGTSLTVQIRDSKGALNYSDKFTVQPSTQTCKPGSTTPTKPGTPSTPTPGSPTNTAPGSTTTSTASATPGNPNTATTTTAAAAAPPPAPLPAMLQESSLDLRSLPLLVPFPFLLKQSLCFETLNE